MSVKAILYGQNYTKQETDGLLAAKANASEVATALNAKANASEVATALNAKANASEVATALNAKADASDITRIDGVLETKADIDQVNDALEDKVNTSSVVTTWPASGHNANANPVSVQAVYSAIQGLSPSGGSSITVDSTLDSNSANPVRNSAITTALNSITTDLSGKAPTNHASSGTTYGKGTDTNYGHVKLYDDVNSSYTASTGIATTPKALYDLSTSFTSSLNTKQDKLTSNNLLPVSLGGTGTNSFTVNSVILANSSIASGALQSIRSSAGALYSTGQDIKPQFGALPLEYGGTGYTDAEKPGFFVAGYANLITNGDFMSVHDWDSSTNVPTGWTRTGNLAVTDQMISYKRIYLTNNAYGSNYAQMQWVTNQLVSNNPNKRITFSVKYGSNAIRTMTAQVNSDGTAITNNNVEFDNMHLYITPKDGYITFTIRLESTQQFLYVYAVKGEFAARQTFQDLYGNLMGSPIPVVSGGTGVSSLPFGDFLGTDNTGRILTSRPTLFDLDNPPYSGIFNVSSSESITGTKPYTSTHTGICLVLTYGSSASNWTEIYIMTRTGSTTGGSPANRAWRRSYFYNGTTGTITDWYEIPYDLASISSALDNKEPAFTTLSISKGGTGASSFTANQAIISNSNGTALTSRAITNNTSNTAITASTAIPTLNTIYYGLPSINGTTYNRSTTIFAPTSAGTSGQFLVSNGSGNAPGWTTLSLSADQIPDLNASKITTGTLPVARGGTGQTTLAAFRNAAGLGNTTGALPVANGGTGATSAANARTNLGAAAATHTHTTSDITDFNSIYSQSFTGAYKIILTANSYPAYFTIMYNNGAAKTGWVSSVGMSATTGCIIGGSNSGTDINFSWSSGGKTNITFGNTVDPNYNGWIISNKPFTLTQSAS